MLPSDQGMIWMNNMFTCYVPKAFEVLVNKKLEGQLDQAWMWMEAMDIHDIQPIEIATRWFCSMVGGEYDYYGVVDNQIKLNDMIFEFIEDEPEIGHTALGAVYFPDVSHEDLKRFRGDPMRVSLQIYNEGLNLGTERGYCLLNSDGKKLFKVGTKFLENGVNIYFFENLV